MDRRQMARASWHMLTKAPINPATAKSCELTGRMTMAGLADRPDNARAGSSPLAVSVRPVRLIGEAWGDKKKAAGDSMRYGL
jgi:hypothetical protein